MSEAAQGEHPAAVAARDLRGDKIYARQPGRIKIDLLHQRLRGASNQPDIGIIGVEIAGQARLYHGKRGDVPAKPVRKILFELLEARFAMTKRASPEQQAHRPARCTAFHQQRDANNG